MRMGRKIVTIGAISAALIPLIIFLLITLTPRPPIGEMKHAREILSDAGKNMAETYSKRLYYEASIYYDSAMDNWQRENNKFLYFRNYDRVAAFAGLSSEKAGQAAENSISSYSDLKTKVKQKIDTLDVLVTDITSLFSTYPLTSDIRNRISKGKFLLKEAEIAYNKGQFLQANRKITDSEYLLTESYENSLADLKEYFESYPIWQKWIDTTIKESNQNHDYSIIIDKFLRKCYVYQNGIKKYEFDVELGKNWVGDKRMSGDKTTPEGMRKITKKFDTVKSEYYKALLLDYPNEDDLKRFRSEITKGTLPASAKIGGNIEIHGNGGKGIDWTEGCVALTDWDMDLIYKIAKVGTPVTIVGSTIDLQHILSR
jgi:hypothetical protein